MTVRCRRIRCRIRHRSRHSLCRSYNRSRRRRRRLRRRSSSLNAHCCPFRSLSRRNCSWSNYVARSLSIVAVAVGTAAAVVVGVEFGVLCWDSCSFGTSVSAAFASRFVCRLMRLGCCGGVTWPPALDPRSYLCGYWRYCRLC